MKKNDLDKIERYINGVADEEEKSQVESLFLNGEDNFNLHHSLEKDWDKMSMDITPSEVNLVYLLDKVHHIIHKKETLKRNRPLQKIIRIYAKVAAILLLPLLIAGGIVYTYKKFQNKSAIDQLVSNTIYAPLGARVVFNLPDGTKGMLNSGSSLSYSIPFTDNRQVTLNGEAWFEVIHNENKSFNILTGNSIVKVKGTSFNMSAYPEENYVEIVLLNGHVEFFDKKADRMVALYPSERLVFQKGKISTSVTDPTKYNAWTEGKLVFRGDPMAEVARRIERWYNVKVELADKVLLKYSFRATFEDDNLEDVLQYLSMTSPIRYQITPRRILTNGTYEKEKVTIYLKN